jgi:ornithine cyclodeaminase/alanine dehydrogenase-like protein (mu-crystallin family)
MPAVDYSTTVPWFTAGLRPLGGAGRVLILCRDDVTSCLRRLDAVEIVRGVLIDHDAAATVLPPEAYLRWDNTQGAYTRSIAMPGGIVRDGRALYGLKVINASVSNPAAGLERAAGLGLCFDPETARVTGVVEVGLISAVRTAAVSAVAVHATGHAEATSLAVAGCGTQGGVHLFLLLERMNGLSRVTLCDADPLVAGQLAERVRAQRPDLEVITYDQPRDAVRDAELVVTTTTVDDGYIAPDWIAPGALVVNVSLADLTDETLLAAGAIYVDDVGLVADAPRRPLGRLMRDGRIAAPGTATRTQKAIDGTIGALLSGRCAAVPAMLPYTVVNPFGMGVIDVALMDAIRRTAAELGLGVEVALG